MSFEIGKTFKFEAAHQLVHHDGKCARPHGHSYEFELVVEAQDVHLAGPESGMVDDYYYLTQVGKEIEDLLDHRDLNEVLDSDTTTAEELSRFIWERAKGRLPNLVEIRFKETAKTYASYRPRRAQERRATEIAHLMLAEALGRLYKDIDTSDAEACWEFPGGKDSDGYGWFSLALANTRKAHRAAAWLAGDNIEGLVVLHLCDNPPCVNPEHLYTGTHAENEADKDRKGRRPRGESSATKLTTKSVLDIEARVVEGESRRGVAARYGISTSMVHAIMSGRVWRHVTGRTRGGK